MTYRIPPPLLRDLKGFAIWMALGVLLVAALSGCAGRLPPPAPPAVEVLVPVPVPCEIEQVPVADKPRTSADMGIFDLVKTVLAERAVMAGENARLRAANTNPCPGEPK